MVNFFQDGILITIVYGLSSLKVKVEVKVKQEKRKKKKEKN